MDQEYKVIRTWKGWTTIENAPLYEAMLREEVFPAVKKKGVKGLEKVSIGTREDNGDVLFFLILQFDSLESVKEFSGEDYKRAYIPENARRILKRFEETADHYSLKDELVFL